MSVVLRRRPTLHRCRRGHDVISGALLHLHVAGRRAHQSTFAGRQSVRTRLTGRLHHPVVNYFFINNIYQHVNDNYDTEYYYDNDADNNDVNDYHNHLLQKHSTTTTRYVFGW